MKIKSKMYLLLNFIINPKANFKNIATLVKPCDIDSKSKKENIENQANNLLGDNWQIIKTTQMLGFSQAGEKLLVALKKQSAPDPIFVDWEKLPNTLKKHPLETFHSRKLSALPQYPRMKDVVRFETKLINALNQHLGKNNVNQEINNLVILGW